MEQKIKSVFLKLEQKNLDGFILSSPANISYLTDYRSRDSYLLISKKENIYFTDSRYIEEAKNNLSPKFSVKKINGSIFKLISGSCCALGLKRVGFEERYLPFAEYQKIKEGLNQRINLVPFYGLVEELRQLKSPEELEKIKKAIQITIAALKFAQDFITPGRKEIEVAAELERFIRYHGAYASSFDIIVACGANSSFPHHISSERKIKNHEPVLIDIGVDYLGYKSDLTRVLFFGKINVYVTKIYNIVRQAQDRAIRKIKPGIPIKEIDAAARQYIKQKGFGGFFSHNLGHGVGLEVHEEPQISPKVDDKLIPGMVFTIEPAIYLANKFGIRWEDMVLVTQKGYQVL